MTAELADAIGYLPFPLGVTATAEHVVVALNPAGRNLLGEVVGRPVRATLPHPALLAALDGGVPRRPPRCGRPAGPARDRRLRPVRDGVLLHVTTADSASSDVRSRVRALQRLTGLLSGAATSSAIARLAVTTAAELLGADAAGVFA